MYLSLFTWNYSFLIYLLPSFSELNSVSPDVSFLRLLIYLHFTPLSLIVYGVGKEHLESEVLLKRMRKIKLDNKNSRETCTAVEQNKYQWKFYIKYMFLRMFRNKNGIDSTFILL